MPACQNQNPTALSTLILLGLRSGQLRLTTAAMLSTALPYCRDEFQLEPYGCADEESDLELRNGFREAPLAQNE
jgi:hypothetical protein